MAASLPLASAFDLCDAEPRQLSLGAGTARYVDATEAREEQSVALAHIVETQIIPRLLVSHPRAAPELGAGIGPELVDKFALYSLSEPPASLLAIVGGLLQRGAPLETIYLDLLGPTARRLGELWVEDRVSYVEVTLGLGRLQHVVRELSVHGDQEIAHALGDRAALFAPAPGEQHTFGLVIIEEFFRRAGWRTWTELPGRPEEVEAAARAHHFDLLGVTASGADRLELIAPLIKTIRQTSRNRDIVVLVGGRLFLEQPELVAEVGADGMALDARDALLRAEGAVKQLACR